MEAAIPVHIVATSAWRSCIVSYIASPAYTPPPGEFMYIWMSFEASTDSKNSSCAMIMFATSSSMGTPRMMMRSIIRRENTSMATAFSWRSSMICGFMYAERTEVV